MFFNVRTENFFERFIYETPCTILVIYTFLTSHPSVQIEVGLDGLQDFINIIVIQDCWKQRQINVMHKSGLFQTNLLKNKFKQFEFLTGSCFVDLTLNEFLEMEILKSTPT